MVKADVRMNTEVRILHSLRCSTTRNWSASWPYRQYIPYRLMSSYVSGKLFESADQPSAGRGSKVAIQADTALLPLRARITEQRISHCRSMTGQEFQTCKPCISATSEHAAILLICGGEQLQRTWKIALSADDEETLRASLMRTVASPLNGPYLLGDQLLKVRVSPLSSEYPSHL